MQQPKGMAMTNIPMRNWFIKESIMWYCRCAGSAESLDEMRGPVLLLLQLMCWCYRSSELLSCGSLYLAQQKSRALRSCSHYHRQCRMTWNWWSGGTVLMCMCLLVILYLLHIKHKTAGSYYQSVPGNGKWQRKDKRSALLSRDTNQREYNCISIRCIRKERKGHAKTVAVVSADFRWHHPPWHQHHPHCFLVSGVVQCILLPFCFLKWITWWHLTWLQYFFFFCSLRWMEVRQIIISLATYKWKVAILAVFLFLMHKHTRRRSGKTGMQWMLRR